MIKTTLLLIVMLGVSAHAQQVSGYFGDRTGVYRNSNPPTRWAEGTNVLWKIPVPNLGNAAPIVAGNRDIVLSEPGWKHDLPVISCYDTATGKLVWEKEIDHLHLTVEDETERQKIRDHWHKHLAWIRATTCCSTITPPTRTAPRSRAQDGLPLHHGRQQQQRRAKDRRRAPRPGGHDHQVGGGGAADGAEPAARVRRRQAAAQRGRDHRVHLGQVPAHRR